MSETFEHKTRDEIHELLDRNSSQLFNCYLAIHKSYIRYFTKKKLKNCHAIAAILSYLEQSYDYYYKERKLIDLSDHGKGYGWFYATIDSIFEQTLYSEDIQTAAIKALKDEGIIDVYTCGLPNRRHFKVNILKALEIKGLQPYDSKNIYSFRKIPKLDSASRSGKSGNYVPENPGTTHIDNNKEYNNKKEREAPDGANSRIDDSSFYPKIGEGLQVAEAKQTTSQQHNINYQVPLQNQSKSNPKEVPPHKCFSSEVNQLYEHFTSFIKVLEPNRHFDQDEDSWKKHLDLLLSKDGRKLQEAIELLQWMPNSTYWGGSIADTPAKFRKKFPAISRDKLAKQHNQQKAKHGNTHSKIPTRESLGSSSGTSEESSVIYPKKPPA